MRPVVPVFLLSLLSTACAREPDTASVRTDDVDGAVVGVDPRPDGRFDVRCRDGETEIATRDGLASASLCSAARATADLTFTCEGATLRISAASSSGGGGVRSIAMRDAETCGVQALRMAWAFGTLARPRVVPVCGADGQMTRFLIRNRGTIVDLFPLPTDRCEVAVESASAPLPPAGTDLNFSGAERADPTVDKSGMGAFLAARANEYPNVPLYVTGPGSRHSRGRGGRRAAPRCASSARLRQTPRRSMAVARASSCLRVRRACAERSQRVPQSTCVGVLRQLT
jgi:hypothetical protein